MKDIFDQLFIRHDFINIDFDKSPFIFISSKNLELNSKIESFLEEMQKKDNIDNNDLEKKGQTITFTYENEKYDIFKNPINFKMFYEDEIKFKAYNKLQLNRILIELRIYYYFFINGCFEFQIDKILLSNNIKEIILYPFFTKLFWSLNYKINANKNKIKIKKESLEPLQLFIEKKEIISETGIDKNDRKVKLEEELIFILNKERKKFIEEIDQYAEKIYTIEPMKIVGNDGVGKSLTLQLYSSIELKGFYKLYFNLKLFQKYGLKNYFFIDLMRGFLTKDSNRINDDIKNYIKCVDYLQKLKNLKKDDFFEVLIELIKYLRKNTNKNTNKYIIILDQFKYEYISEDNFKIFISNIDILYFRLVICCSLNDGKIKNNMFSEYENDIKIMDDFQEESKQQSKENNIYEMDIDDNDSNSKTEENTINLRIINILKKKRENIINKNLLQKTNKEKDEKKVNISLNNKNDFIQNEKSLNNNSKEGIIDEIGEVEYIYGNTLKFPEHKGRKISCNTSPINIYYNNLVDLKDIIKEQEPEEIYNFMGNFNYSPKYYKKFVTFRLIQNIKNLKDNSEIIENYKNYIISKIGKNIKNFYLTNSNFDFENNNFYNYILEFKNNLNLYNNRKINIKELYNFSKKYPMKYIIVESENDSNDIRFNNSILNKNFSINYSFPIVEYAIYNIIEEYDNKNKIKINDLSGSAFGNALELKLREYFCKLENKIEIRKVWVLNQLNEKIKKKKLKEIENKTLNSNRYKNLEDIFDLKPLHDSYCVYFYPENQDNYLLDSILIINQGNNNFSLIVFQITKYKNRKEIKSKQQFQKYIVNNIKTKFENLYGINIINIYLWFILSNDHIENNDTCKVLISEKIKYVFYSINESCLFQERNSHKIDQLLFFEKKEALIYSKYNNYNDENNIKIEPLSIDKFEDKLVNLSMIKDTINYEKIRKSFFRNNFGLNIKSLRNSIYDTIKAINNNKKNFYMLFLFSFPFIDFYKYKNSEDLIFIFKYKKVSYFRYKNNFYEIDCKNKKIKHSKILSLDLDDFINLNNEISYEEEEIDISVMKDMKDSQIIYLYKIYYIDE